MLAARAAREAKSLAQYAEGSPFMQKFATLRDMHRFLYAEHGAYATSRLLKARKKLSAKAKASY